MSEKTIVEIENKAATTDIIQEKKTDFFDLVGTKEVQSQQLDKETKKYQPNLYKQFSSPELSNLVVNEIPRKGENVTDGRWAVQGDIAYSQSSPTADKLSTGVYRTVSTMAGLFLVKQKMLADALLTLPDDASTEILEHIKEFWGLKERFRQFGFLHKRGVLLYGPQGCHAKGSKVLMYDGSWKKVEDIKVNDKVMGPDSESRNVLELKHGKDNMVKVIPTKGKSFVVNENHILSLEWSGQRENKGIINISVKEYKELSDWQKSRWMLYKSKVIQYNKDKNKEFKIPPYILGLWLGDGTSSNTSLTTMDQVIKNAWCNWGLTFPTIFVRKQEQVNNKSSVYSLSVGNTAGLNLGREKNPIKNLFKELDLINNKHIPQKYLTSSIEQRKQLLAGLIDTDGYVRECNIEFTMVSEKLIDDITLLAQSLGYATNKRIKIINGKDYYRLTIICDEECSSIPTIIPHKKLINRIKEWKSPLRTSFKLENLEKDNYYGFILDKDHLYVMEDHFISHNSGKTSTIIQTIKAVTEEGGVVLLGGHPGSDTRAIQMFRKLESERPLVVIYEDVDDVVYYYGDKALTELLDGEANVDNVLFIATTNHPERLPARLVNRPSRFDVLKFIGMPSEEARFAYLKAKTDMSPGELKIWAKKTDGLSISHLKELIILVKVLEKQLDESIDHLKGMRRVPNSSDFGTEIN